MLPYLYELKTNFTQFGFEIAMSMTSIYSTRLYEMLCGFKHTGLLRLSVTELKERLQVQNQYARFSNFEAKVLKVAENEINTKADFSVSYSLIRNNRNVERIDFSISEKAIQIPQPENLKNTEGVSVVKKHVFIDHTGDIRFERTIERLKEHCLSDQKIQAILNKATIDEIVKILYTVGIDDKILSKGGFICTHFKVSNV